MSRPASFLRNATGAAAAEFALVLPVALLFLLGTIDIGRYFWQINQLEKAVQAGTRYAVSTGVVASGLNTADFSGVDCSGDTVSAGDTICKDALGTVTCSKSANAVSCSCVESALGTASCPTGIESGDTVAFDRIVARMQVIYAGVPASAVRVRYSGSGIGFAGDPATDDAGNDLPDVAPIVTVEVTSFSFRSMSLLGYGIRLPGFRYSQTLEDGDGAIAY